MFVFQVLNEVVVDRGPSSYLSNVDLFLDGHLITTVQGDGEWADNLGKNEDRNTYTCTFNTSSVRVLTHKLDQCCM